MKLDQKTILEQIHSVESQSAKLGRHGVVPSHQDLARGLTLIGAALERFSPPGSPYVRNAQAQTKESQGLTAMGKALGILRGYLDALKFDYENGYMQSVIELAHADVFADFLSMAEYLLSQGYKDPSAVIAGSVLEQH